MVFNFSNQVSRVCHPYLRKFLSSDQELLEVGLSVCLSVCLSSKQDSKQAVQTEFPNKLCIQCFQTNHKKKSLVFCVETMQSLFGNPVWTACLESRSRAYVPIDRGPVTVVCQVLLLTLLSKLQLLPVRPSSLSNTNSCMRDENITPIKCN